MINFANSWQDEPVREWTELEKMTFGLVLELFNRLADGSTLLKRLASLIDTIKFCVPREMPIELWHGGRRYHIDFSQFASIDALCKSLQSNFRIALSCDFFKKMQPGLIWMICPDIHGEMRLFGSLARKFYDPQTKENMICICPTIFTRQILACCALCEELAHVDSKNRDNTITTKQLELEGVLAREELLQLARQQYGTTYGVDISYCEAECTATKAYWNSI